MRKSMAMGTMLTALLLGAITERSPLVAADVAHGEQVFAKCKACHTLEAKNKIGPSLHGLFGRTAGTVADFNYSDAMKAAGAKGVVWGEDTLEKYLAGPKDFVPGNKMPFPGLKDPKDREDVIAYLKGASQ